MVALLHAIVLIGMFTLVSTSAQAHAPVKSDGGATHGNTFNQHPHELDCAFFNGSSHRLHCYLTSTGAEATGPTRPLNDDQPELFALATLPIARDIEIQSALAATHIPITEPPCFILFGNFRS